MGNFSLRRYDTQARVSVVLAIASCVSLLGMILLIFRHPGIFLLDYTIPCSPLRRGLILLSGLVTILLGTAGFGMGLNSAGQRRNDKPRLSWMGFFISAGVVCIALVLLFLFRARGETVIT